MRFGAGFGLLSLLVVMAIGFYLYFGGPGGGMAGQALQVKKDLEPKVQQMAGRDENGARVTDAITLDMHGSGSRYDAVIVETIDPASALASKYDLRPGDLITQIGGLSVRDQITSDDAAKDYLLDAYQKSQPLEVTRGTQKLTIVFGVKTPALLSTPVAIPDQALPAATPTEKPPSPAAPATPPDNRSSLQKQLDGITQPR